jgi:sarcosine oxidase, subunit beta
MPIRYLSGPPDAADLVVVGGGVVGAATAFHAVRAGLRPVILEARPRLCTLTTPVAAGAFRLQFETLEELELARESARTFLHFAEVTEQTDYELEVAQNGYLWLTTDPARAAAQRELVDRLHGWGQDDVEVVDGDEVRSRWPWVGPDVVQARWRADDGFLDTKRLTFGLVAGSGAEVVTSCPVTGFDVHGGRLAGVRTPAGDVSCGAAVICAGPLSGIVASAAGIDLPVVTITRQKLILPEIPEVPADGPMTIDEDRGAHWRPAGRGAWLLYSDPATEPSEPTDDVRPDHRFAFRLLDPASPVAAARVVPFWRDVWERAVDHWMLQAGQYTVTRDYRPLIGETGIAGLFVNTGYSGHGIMLGPAGGRLCADALTGRLTESPFAPGREPPHMAQPTL